MFADNGFFEDLDEMLKTELKNDDPIEPLTEVTGARQTGNRNKSNSISNRLFQQEADSNEIEFFGIQDPSPANKYSTTSNNIGGGFGGGVRRNDQRASTMVDFNSNRRNNNNFNAFEENDSSSNYKSNTFSNQNKQGQYNYFNGSGSGGNNHNNYNIDEEIDGDDFIKKSQFGMTGMTLQTTYSKNEDNLHSQMPTMNEFKPFSGAGAGATGGTSANNDDFDPDVGFSRRNLRRTATYKEGDNESSRGTGSMLHTQKPPSNNPLFNKKQQVQAENRNKEDGDILAVLDEIDSGLQQRGRNNIDKDPFAFPSSTNSRSAYPAAGGIFDTNSNNNRAGKTQSGGGLNLDLEDGDTGDYNPSVGSRLAAARRPRNSVSVANSMNNSNTRGGGSVHQQGRPLKSQEDNLNESGTNRGFKLSQNKNESSYMSDKDLLGVSEVKDNQFDLDHVENKFSRRGSYVRSEASQSTRMNQQQQQQQQQQQNNSNNNFSSQQHLLNPHHTHQASNHGSIFGGQTQHSLQGVGSASGRVAQNQLYNNNNNDDLKQSSEVNYNIDSNNGKNNSVADQQQSQNKQLAQQTSQEDHLKTIAYLKQHEEERKAYQQNLQQESEENNKKLRKNYEEQITLIKSNYEQLLEFEKTRNQQLQDEFKQLILKDRERQRVLVDLEIDNLKSNFEKEKLAIHAQHNLSNEAIAKQLQQQAEIIGLAEQIKQNSHQLNSISNQIESTSEKNQKESQKISEAMQEKQRFLNDLESKLKIETEFIAIEKKRIEKQKAELDDKELAQSSFLEKEKSIIRTEYSRLNELQDQIRQIDMDHKKEYSSSKLKLESDRSELQAEKIRMKEEFESMYKEFEYKVELFESNKAEFEKGLQRIEDSQQSQLKEIDYRKHEALKQEQLIIAKMKALELREQEMKHKDYESNQKLQLLKHQQFQCEKEKKGLRLLADKVDSETNVISQFQSEFEIEKMKLLQKQADLTEQERNIRRQQQQVINEKRDVTQLQDALRNIKSNVVREITLGSPPIATPSQVVLAAGGAAAGATTSMRSIHGYLSPQKNAHQSENANYFGGNNQLNYRSPTHQNLLLRSPNTAAPFINNYNSNFNRLSSLQSAYKSPKHFENQQVVEKEYNTLLQKHQQQAVQNEYTKQASYNKFDLREFMESVKDINQRQIENVNYIIGEKDKLAAQNKRAIIANTSSFAQDRRFFEDQIESQNPSETHSYFEN